MRGLVVSLVLHVAAALVLATSVRAVPIAPPPPPPLAIEVAMLPPPVPSPTERAPEAPLDERSSRPASSSVRPAPRRPASREPAAEAVGTPQAGNPALLSMRRPGVTASEAPAGPTDVIVPSPTELYKPEGAPPSTELPRGALLGPPRAPRPYVPHGDPTGRELGHGVVADGDGGYVEDRMAYRGRIDRDGSIRFKDKGNVGIDDVGAGVGGITLSGHFDLTDAVMRALGDDPYAYEKMKLMEETREVRAGMAVRDRSERLHDAQRKLSAYLDRIWHHGQWTVAQKRRIFFALWEEASEEGDPELQRAGKMARATILAFVRRRLPEGSADAYGDAELADLNRGRKSRSRFEPYAR